jgi:uncharacterized delta-60 repeat protein
MKLLALALVGAALLAPSATAAPGALDPTWGRSGFATASFPGLDAQLLSIALLPDGKVVAAGRVAPAAAMTLGVGDVGLARFLPSGRLDATFGRGGTVRTRLTGRDRVVKVLARPDGRLLVVVVNGYLPHYEFGKPPIRTLRYGRDGALDRAYGGGDGIAELATGHTAVRDAVLQQGRVVLLATMHGRDDLVGLSLDGRVERVVRPAIRIESSNQQPSLAATPNGDVLVVGKAASAERGFVGRYDRSLRLVRRYPGPVQASLCPQAVAAGSDGSVVLAGPEHCGRAGGREGVHFVRYDRRGRQDLGFGRRGLVSLLLAGDNDTAEHHVRLGILRSGAIVVAALPIRVVNVRLDESSTRTSTVTPDVGVFRLTASGALDRTFAPDGETRFDVSPGAALATAVAGLELTPGGTIVVGATSEPALPIFPSRPRSFTVARLQGGDRRGLAATLSIRQVDASGLELACGRNRQTACPLPLGEQLRLAGRVSPNLAGAAVTVRLFGAYWEPDRDVFGQPFEEVRARVRHDGGFLANVPTLEGWYAGYAQAQAHLPATATSHDVRSPLRHVLMARR